MESGGVGESDVSAVSWWNKQQIDFFMKSSASAKFAHLVDVAWWSKFHTRITTQPFADVSQLSAVLIYWTHSKHFCTY